MRVTLPPLALLLALSPLAAAGDWRGVFSSELRATEHDLEVRRAELAALGDPVVGNTVPQFGYQTNQKPVPSPESPWVQVDLGSSQAFDTIALVPVLVDFQPLARGAYGFPRRFRVDASDDASFAVFTPLFVHTDDDFPPPGVAPVVIPAAGKARYIRVTVTKPAEENHTFFVALGELMVLRGNRNIALGGAVKASETVNLPPRWHTSYLTDGRSPLGPPIRHGVLPAFDAIFAEVRSDGSPAWMALDLGAEMTLDEVRLHPLHARQGADVPGFRFPLQFRVELASRPDFADARVLFDTAGEDYPNPGNNPVTIRAEGQSGRFVRLVMEKSELPTVPEFALSELEVQASGQRVSTGKMVTTSGDPRRDHERPISQLADGFTSYGQLMELPQWLDEWARRTELHAAVGRLEQLLPGRIAVAERRAAWTAVAVLGGISAGGVALVLRARRVRAGDKDRFRTRLAQDLHDEIGSNLAGIAVLSETAAQLGDAGSEDWREIHRIAQESSEAMREVLWLVGARQEMGIDLGRQMQTAAARLLPGRAIEWTHPPDDLPPSWSMETRRQIFLFFKEALTNVVRHARADKVELSSRVDGGIYELRIRDNGLACKACATGPPQCMAFFSSSPRLARARSSRSSSPSLFAESCPAFGSSKTTPLSAAAPVVRSPRRRTATSSRRLKTARTRLPCSSRTRHHRSSC